jgi:glycosyltransferase involved in cell wall biosynthesis
VNISAAIITLNEERNLPRAFDSLDCVDEIVVVDCGSTDSTREIACAHGARVIENPWPGYAAQKNFAAAQASHDWVLSIDADEALSEPLSAEIMRIKREGARAAGYRFPRRAQYLGRWILHSGWYPDYKLRLYDRRRGAWQGEYVHESVRVEGPVETLRADLLHYTCDSLGQHLRTLDRYTTLAAAQLRARGCRAGLLRLLFAPPWTFLKTYVLRQGFRDGYQGFLISVLAAWYVFLKWAKTRERDLRPET